MLSSLLTPGLAPFTFALGLLFGLMLVELITALMGGSLLGAGADAEMDLGELGDINLAELDLPSGALEGVDTSEFELPEPESFDMEASTPDAGGGLASWLGLGRTPFLVWLASLLLGFGLAGLTLQSVVLGLFGAALPGSIASLIAALPAVLFARHFARLFATLLPKTETSAMAERHLARREGVVSQGTAARGRPAEVRLQDRFGNTHYIRAEPLSDGEAIPQGTRVFILRHRATGGFRLIALE